jgi:D-glycero-D-manno-heptose 1,7-bisphosphate phosphatase
MVPGTARYTVFLDRDGVINRDSANYITSWAQFDFLPGSLEAVARLTRAGLAVIVITNQSAVGRGMMDLSVLEAMHRNLRSAVEKHGGRIDAIFYCPHHPEDRCRCRKPEPGLIYQAQRQFKLDLRSATMIGDRAKDIQCGMNACCGRTILVQSGLHDDLPRLQTLGMLPNYVAADLSVAVDWLLAQPMSA